MSSEQEDRIHLFEALTRIAVVAFERGGMDAVRRIGIEGMTEEDMCYLANLRLSEIRKLLDAPVFPIIAITVPAQMQLMRKLANTRQEEMAELEQLVLAGASFPLLASEYGITGEDFVKLRQRLGVTSNGRPPLLSEKQERQMHDVWRKNMDKPSRKRWLALARAGIPLNSAWAAVQKGRAEEERREESSTDPSGR